MKIQTYMIGFRDNSVQEITTRNWFGIGRNRHTHTHTRKCGVKQVGLNFGNILGEKRDKF